MLDLVPESTVKVNDVTVGKVTDVSLDGLPRRRDHQLRNDTKLPDNAVADDPADQPARREVRLARARPRATPARPLQNGDVIPLDRTGRNPEVEEVLGALSLLLNGGGVASSRPSPRAQQGAAGPRGARPGRCSSRSDVS